MKKHAPSGAGKDIPCEGTKEPRLMARRNVFRPWRAGRACNPPFSFAERKCAVDGGKETGALPGQGFGRDPSAGGYDGSWAFCRTSVRGNNPGEEFGGRPGRLTIAGAVFLLPQIGGRIGGCVGRTPNAPAVILLPQSGGRRGGYVNPTQKAPAPHRTAAAKRKQRQSVTTRSNPDCLCLFVPLHGSAVLAQPPS